MKRRKRTALLVAAAMLAVGLALMAVALPLGDFDRTVLEGTGVVTGTQDGTSITIFGVGTTTTNVYTIDQYFYNIHIEGAECDIRLVPSEDGTCTVRCTEPEKLVHKVEVTDGTLTIKRTDLRPWYLRVGPILGEISVEVHLPADRYEELYLSNASGGIDVPAQFSFAEANVESVSGDLSFLASADYELLAQTVSGDLTLSGVTAGNVTAATTSGDLTLSDLTVDAALRAATTSGRLSLTDTVCETLTTENVSGETRLTRVLAHVKMDLESVSGQIRLEGSDSDALDISTVSGDVTGYLNSDKIFHTETTSGSVLVPNSASGGPCRVETTSGNIYLLVGEPDA